MRNRAVTSDFGVVNRDSSVGRMRGSGRSGASSEIGGNIVRGFVRTVRDKPVSVGLTVGAGLLTAGVGTAVGGSVVGSAAFSGAGAVVGGVYGASVFDRERRAPLGGRGLVLGEESVSYTHLTLPTTPYV